MIFFLRFQAQRLNKYTEKVGTQKKNHPERISMPEARKALDDVNSQHCRFILATRTTWGKMKSFLPGTVAYMVRNDYANSIKIAFSALSEVEKKLNQLSNSSSPSKQIRQCKSEPLPIPAQPKIHKPIFSKSIPIIDGGVQIQYVSRYPIRLYI